MDGLKITDLKVGDRLLYQHPLTGKLRWGILNKIDTSDNDPTVFTIGTDLIWLDCIIDVAIKGRERLMEIVFEHIAQEFGINQEYR